MSRKFSKTVQKIFGIVALITILAMTFSSILYGLLS
ncbi:MAG: hypothetical protein ACD_66C00276G0002 [uncultured bacterium]|nr:MAG: hypothetical protein ACD_66C00276G0002 [uncultured bacterium]